MKNGTLVAFAVLFGTQVARAGTADMVNRALSDALREHAEVKREYRGNEMEDAAYLGLADRSDRMALELAVDVGSVRKEYPAPSEAEPPVQEKLGAVDLPSLERAPAKMKPVVR